MKKMNLIDCHWTNRGPAKSDNNEGGNIEVEPFWKGFFRPACRWQLFAWPIHMTSSTRSMWRSITIWHISMAHCIAISISIPIPICINLLIAVTEVRCNVECVWQNKQWDISDLQPSINKVKSIRFHVAALAGRELFSIIHDDSQQNGKL